MERNAEWAQPTASIPATVAMDTPPTSAVRLPNSVHTATVKDGTTQPRVVANCVEKESNWMRHSPYTHTPSSSPPPSSSPLPNSLIARYDVIDDVTPKKFAPNFGKVSPTDVHFSTASTPSPTSHLLTRHTSTPSPVTPSLNVTTSDPREQPEAAMETGGINFSQLAKNSSNDKNAHTLNRRNLQLYDDREMDCGEIGKTVGHSVEPVLLASAVSTVDQNRSLTANSNVRVASAISDCVPEAKRSRLTSPVQNSKQQQTITQQQTPQQTQQLIPQQPTQVSLRPILQQRQIVTKQPQTRQTSYTTSSIRFVSNKSPLVSSAEPNQNQSNKSQTGSGNSVRPVCLWENCMR